MAGQPGRSGGARPGAGRKPIREKFADAVGEVEELIAEALPELAEQLIESAVKSQRVTEKYKAAGLVLVDEVLNDQYGEAQIGLNDQAVTRKVPLFPDKEPDEMVLVERTVKYDPPNFLAIRYLIDRIAGKPITPSEEPEIAPEEVASVIEEMRAAVEANVRDGEQKTKLAETLRQRADRISGASGPDQRQGA